MIHIDTHIAVWLAGGEGNRLSAASRSRIIGEDVRVSPMVQLELGHLYEIKRITRPPAEVLTSLSASIGLTLSTAPFSSIVAHAMDITWTRDTFDRLIVATALADGAQLVTADRVIRANLTTAVWD